MLYLDSSALVKLVIAETESAALRRYLRSRPERATCALAKVEVLRAVRPHGSRAISRARSVFERLDVIAMDEELLERAAVLDPAVLRSLDAIHLAAAQTLADQLTELVTYDDRMAGAATSCGITVVRPR